MSTQAREINKEVQFGFLPAMKQEREFGLWDFIFIQVGFGIAAWCFLVGGYTGMTLDAKNSIVAILFGNAFPVFLIMPIAIYFARYGVETFIGFRSALGYLGSDAFFVLFAILNLGWIYLSCFMIGESSIKIAGVMEASGFWTSRESGAPVFALIAYFFALFIVFKGPNAIKWFTRIGVPAIFIILIGLIGIIFFKEGIGKVFSLSPQAPYETFSRSFATAIEWNVGLGFSWLPYIGAASRLTKNENIAYAGGFWGFGVLLNVAAIMGALTALLVGSTDPTDWMVAFGGASFGLIGLLLLVLANTTSAVVLMYAQALSFKTLFPSKKWIWAICTTLPAALLMLNPAFYDSYNLFLSFISFVMAIFGGIIITDFLFVKKQRIEVRDLYRRGGHYQYWKGVNPAAIVSFISGTIFFWSLYNPLADEASVLFPYMSAGIPTFFVSAVVHYVSAKYIFRLDQEKPRKILKKEAM